MSQTMLDLIADTQGTSAAEFDSSPSMTAACKAVDVLCYTTLRGVQHLHRINGLPPGPPRPLFEMVSILTGETLRKFHPRACDEAPRINAILVLPSTQNSGAVISAQNEQDAEQLPTDSGDPETITSDFLPENPSPVISFAAFPRYGLTNPDSFWTFRRTTPSCVHLSLSRLTYRARCSNNQDGRQTSPVGTHLAPSGGYGLMGRPMGWLRVAEEPKS
ncbi:hypothetical protein B0H16DRAFT_1718202 [Mycena metata]|uniref:Uncharacterized protein n=1 Tax=Mycena metata TaxID=1033252 RepID=A0AAD7JJS1_9AGAR|nr:hypothetical protein B0H16DRAFT_1718202 [Mycena metata]